MRGQLNYHPEWWRYFGGLADKIEDFGGKWDIAREDLREGLRSQADVMQAIVDTFRDLDRTMAEDGGQP